LIIPTAAFFTGRLPLRLAQATREHWIQHITFTIETNAEDKNTQRDSMTDGRRATQY